MNDDIIRLIQDCFAMAALCINTAQKRTTASSSRPSALTSSYKKMDRFQLTQAFKSDVTSKALITAGPAPRPDIASMRICQWNVHSCNWKASKGSTKGSTKGSEAACEIADTVLRMNPDVVVLNECGSSPGQITREVQQNRYSQLAVLGSKLREKGYTLVESPNDFPTTIATRLPLVSSSKLFLGTRRGAVCARIRATCGTVVVSRNTL